MTDVVYVLGRGSGWGNNELRYSLRSLEKNLIDLGTVFVIGERPNWLTGVVHHHFPDAHICKERNIMIKLAYACGHPDLGRKFLHVHDDHFMMAPMWGKDIPYWRGGSLDSLADSSRRKAPGNHWVDAVQNTFNVLAARKLTTHNFDLHLPMTFDKIAYPETMDLYDWANTPRGFVVKSLYANTLGIKGVYSRDVKINVRLDMKSAVVWLKGKPFFSVGNGGLHLRFKELLAALYPTPSRFEIK